MDADEVDDEVNLVGEVPRGVAGKADQFTVRSPTPPRLRPTLV